MTFPALLGTGSNAGVLNGGAYDSSTYTFNSPTAPGVQTISAANGVTNPAAETAATRSTSRSTPHAPATTATFPLNNGSYDNTTRGTARLHARRASAARSTISRLGRRAGRRVDQGPHDRQVLGRNRVRPVERRRSTPQPGRGQQLELRARPERADGSALVSRRALLGRQRRQRRGAPADPVHLRQRRRRPATTLTLSSASHAYLSATAPYVLYYGTDERWRQLHAPPVGDRSERRRHDRASRISPARPASAATAAPRRTAAAPIRTSRPRRTASRAAPRPRRPPRTWTRPTCAATSRTTRSRSCSTTARRQAARSTINGGNIYSTTAGFPVSHVDYTGDAAAPASPPPSSRSRRRRRRTATCGSFGSAAPAANGTFAGAQGTCYRFTLTGTDNVGNVAAISTDVKVDTTAPSQPTRHLRQPLERQHVRRRRRHPLLPAFRRRHVPRRRVFTRRGVRSPGLHASRRSAASRARASPAARCNVTFNGASTGSARSRCMRRTTRDGLDRRDLQRHARLDCSERRRTDCQRHGGDGRRQLELPHERRLGRALDDAVQRRRLRNAERGRDRAAGGTRERHLRKLRRPHDRRRRHATASRTATATSSRSRRPTRSATSRPCRRRSRSTRLRRSPRAIAFTRHLGGQHVRQRDDPLLPRRRRAARSRSNANGASDPETGIRAGNAGYTFSSLGGFLSQPRPGNHVDVTFDGTSSGGGTFSVAANNNAGVASSPTSFNVVKDATAPVNGLLSINPYSGSHSVAVDGTAVHRRRLRDRLATSLTRSDAQAATGGVCPAGGYTGSNAVTLPNDTVPADGCYEYIAHRHRPGRQHQHIPDDRPRRHDRPDGRLGLLRRRPLEPEPHQVTW